MYLMNKDYY